MNPPAGGWSIASADDASAPGCDLVRQWLREHNHAANPVFMRQLGQPEHEARPLVLTVVADGREVGGLIAETRLAWLRISIMAVAPEWRSRGLGSALLEEAVRRAVERGCVHAYVDTMDYQAPGFYLAHGFAIVGEIPDWDSSGHGKFFLTKRLR
ncbi:GNAT family N-acetyltransferase [Luteolibacter yonseiensis]|uniref:GNAT family N-acetyltransferase n=1 Tax=Luteolibacter yonseiensis TaxID=1144680 RepID=A0A934R3C8_9BACT|nr:GNAT family N-acetyltransferase [Luteolibacter yonseiensis]MBK1815702.1 GNAT family N-acetyltransferase [Luteolibacter yonseiensis]